MQGDKIKSTIVFVGLFIVMAFLLSMLIDPFERARGGESAGDPPMEVYQQASYMPSSRPGLRPAPPPKIPPKPAVAVKILSNPEDAFKAELPLRKGVLDDEPMEGDPALSGIFSEATGLLTTFPLDKDMEEYPSNLEKAMVLYFKALRQSPRDPRVYTLLGRLSEIRALWAKDPNDRRALVDEAQAFFARGARMEFDRSFDENDLKKYEEKLSSGPLGDPYLTSLTWAGSLRRGELGLEELRAHHAVGKVPPEHVPGFWEERYFILENGSDDDSKAAIRAAVDEFRTQMAIMPTEVHVISPNNRLTGKKFKKSQVINSWGLSLMNLSSTTKDPAWKAELFLEGLRVLEGALLLPLDDHEYQELFSSLIKADYNQPQNDLRAELFKVKDKFFASWLKDSTSPEVLLHQGSDLLLRALQQTESKPWATYLAQALSSYERYLEKSPDPYVSAFRVAELLERQVNSLDHFLSLSPEDTRARKSELLALSIAFYQKAMEPSFPALLTQRALAQAQLRLAMLSSDDETFSQRFSEAAKTAHSHAMRDIEPGSAFFQWGETLLLQGIPERLPQGATLMTSEAIASFRQCLRAGTSDPERLQRMANLTYQVASLNRAQRVPALNLLIDLSSRLKDLRPMEPAYRFAYGLSLLSRIAAEEDFPGDRALFASPSFKGAFLEALSSFSQALELASYGNPSDFTPWGLDIEDRFSRNNTQDSVRAPNPSILAPSDDFISFPRPAATHREMLSGTLNQHMLRLFSMLPPQSLPPWYKLRLASFLRRTASTGYLPREEECAYFRLAYRILDEALDDLPIHLEDMFLSPLILSEQALILGESTLSLDPEDKTPLSEANLQEARTMWDKAESEGSGSSLWARARWAAWSRDEEALKGYLSQSSAQVSQGDAFYWPSFSEAALEPAFRDFRDQPWFKKAWFGYQR
ncbi:MAG: hypothetical protein LBE27_04315 [Deltaproteobacteria bacterium]|jgi:hypothetical protein|nr:hypothetical protein [Deltaproteobacteria bacterium]